MCAVIYAHTCICTYIYMCKHAHREKNVKRLEMLSGNYQTYNSPSIETTPTHTSTNTRYKYYLVLTLGIFVNTHSKRIVT